MGRRPTNTLLSAEYLSAYKTVCEKSKNAKGRVLPDTAKLIHRMVVTANAYLIAVSNTIPDCLKSEYLAKRLSDAPALLPVLLRELNTGIQWFDLSTRALLTSGKPPASSEFLELSPNESACLAIHVGTHLMKQLSALTNDQCEDIDLSLHFAHQIVLLYAATLSLELPKYKKEIFRQHGRTVSRKLGKSEEEAKQIILSLAKTMLAEDPNEYLWKTEKKAGQIRLNHLADRITNKYNAMLRKQGRNGRITISSIQKYLRKLIHEGELKGA